MQKIIAIFARALPYLKSAGSWFVTVEGGPLGWALGIFDALLNSSTGRLFLMAVTVFSLTWFWCWTSEHSKIDAAVAVERGKLTDAIKKANGEADARLARALAEANKVQALPANITLAAVKRLCDQQPKVCRDAIKK